MLDKQEPVVTRRRLGTPEDPYLDLTEYHTVGLDGKVFLTEIPERFSKVRVVGSSISWSEIEDEELSLTNYTVNYQSRMITFHQDNAGLQLQFIYKGTGYQYVPSSSVYTKYEEGQVTETLQDVINEGKAVISNSAYAKEQGDYAKAQGDYSKTEIVNMQTKIDEANAVIAETNTAKTNAQTATTNANTATQNANVATANANNVVDTMKYIGEYTAITNYKKNNIVSYNNEIFIALKDQVGITPVNDGLSWKLYLTAKTEIQNAIDSANLATEKANYANTEATNATTQATYAKNQGDFAKTQGDYALAQGDNAKLEASNLSTLKTNVETATTNANTATTNANTATANTNTAISNAETATADANRATNNANTATTNANLARDNANTQATYAKNQGDYALAQGDIAKTESSNLSTMKTDVQTATDNANYVSNNFKYIGVYSSTVSYKRLNMVSLNGSTYMALVDNTGIAVTDTTKWQLMAQRGVDGEGRVQSVNGKYDVVVLNATDVGAIASTEKGAVNGVAKLNANGKVVDSSGNIVEVKVSSVNGQTGAVVIDYQTPINTAEANAKAYADTKIAEMVDSAPETLDTLNELATALGNDPNFATTMTNELATKATKTELSTHTGDTTVHITATERSNWNSKASGDHTHTSDEVTYLGEYVRNASDDYTLYPKGVSAMFVSATEGFPDYGTVQTVRGYSGGGGTFQIYTPYNDSYGGKNLRYRIWKYGATSWSTWESYASLSDLQAHIDDNVKHITSTERTDWNAKETTTGAQTKATQAKDDAIAWAKSYGLGDRAKILGSTVDLNTLLTTGFYYGLSSNPNNPYTSSVYLQILRYSDVYVKQIAFQYDGHKIWERYNANGVWSTWQEIETTAGSQSKVDTHANKKDNPHAVTASQVGAVAKTGDNMTGGLSFNSKFTIQYNSTENSLDFIFNG